MQTKTAQALLKVLLHLQKGSALQLLEAYGEFYSSLLAGGFGSWQEYLLDQILAGANNPWAKGLAKGGLAAGAALDAAVEYDLDVLQGLAVTEATLVGWIREVAPAVPTAWLDAAGRLPRQDAPALNGSSAAVPEAGAMCSAPPYIQGPLNERQRRQWRRHIGDKWRWSEAVPDLRYYYATYGCGLLSRYNTLVWTGGAFHAYAVKQEDDNPVRARFRALEVYAVQRNALWENLRRHVNGQPANHTLAVGDGRGCQSWFIWDAALEAAAEYGPRFIKLPSKEVSTIMELGRALGEHPRMRFVVVIDPLEVEKGSDEFSAVLTALAGFGPSGWPDNALLLASAYSSSAVVADAALAELSRFPSMRLTFSMLTEAEYLGAVATLMGSCDPNGDRGMSAALQYGYQQGFSVRSAYEYALESYIAGHAILPMSSMDDVQ